MVEQQTAASHSLAREAEALTSLIGHFNLGAGATTRVASFTSSPAPTAPRVAPAAAAKPIYSTKPSFTPAAVKPTARPVASPARALGNTLAKAFGAPAETPVLKASEQNWEEF